MLGASWFKCLGRAGSSVWGELVQVLGASWFKCLGRAGTTIRGEIRDFSILSSFNIFDFPILLIFSNFFDFWNFFDFFDF